MEERKDERRSKVLAIALVIMLTSVAAYSLVSVKVHRTSGIPLTGYEILDPVLEEDFTDGSAPTAFLPTTSSSFSRGGMTFDVLGKGSGLSVRKPVSMDKASVSLDITGVMRHKDAAVKVSFHISSGENSYLVNVVQFRHHVDIGCDFVVQGFSGTVYDDMFYDERGVLNVLLEIRDGEIGIGINGIPGKMEVPSSGVTVFSLEKVEMVGENEMTKGHMTISSFQVGNGSPHRYIDVLHKTIVPDGKDFCFTLHIHADRAYPKMFELMAEEAIEHGVHGTYDAWYFSHLNQFGTDDAVFREALRELNEAGWDVGIHAGGAMDLTREKVIAAIENISAEYGPISTWSDHGFRQQDICENGTTLGSIYYVKDLIKDIGAVCSHEWHSASSFYDLNLEGMSYSRAEYGDLPLFRVSFGQALMFYQNPGRQEDVGSWLRSWASERSVFVNHDYFPYFFYVTNATGRFSVLPEDDGIAQFPWSDLNPRKVFSDSAWHMLPSFHELLNWTGDHNIWYATVRDVYDRSCLLQQVEVYESPTRVTVKNPTSLPIKGFTLYTKSPPWYHLVSDGNKIEAEKGTGGSWHFVIDIGPNETLTLEKERNDMCGPQLSQDLGNETMFALPVLNIQDRHKIILLLKFGPF